MSVRLTNKQLWMNLNELKALYTHSIKYSSVKYLLSDNSISLLYVLCRQFSTIIKYMFELNKGSNVGGGGRIPAYALLKFLKG